MKLYYNGFNLYHQFPHEGDVVENFTEHECAEATGIEVSYHFSVWVVADTLVLQGAKNEKFAIQKRIAQISCSDDKVLVLLDDGDLIKVTDTITKLPKLEDLHDGDCVKKISCGSKIAVALTKWGYLYNIPNKLKYSNVELTEITAGREHCLLLDIKGNIFSFGRGSRGQLGHGSLDDEEEPKLVEALAGINIVGIAAGGWHSCAVSKEGDLYIWGWNGNGQLGLLDISVMATPMVLDLDFNVQMVSCGTRHTVILTDKEILYGCGSNKYKQLSREEKEVHPKMTLLRDFAGDEVHKIKCGPWNTMVIVSSKSGIKLS